MAWSTLRSPLPDGTQWTNALFSVPAVVNQNEPFDLAVSDIMDNNSGAENLDVVIRFDAMDPGGRVEPSPNVFVDPSYIINIIVEEQLDDGTWNSVAESFGQPFNTLQNGILECKFIIQTRNTTDPGQPFNTSRGFKYYVNENPSEDLRVRIEVTDFSPMGAGALVSANITGSFRFY